VGVGVGVAVGAGVGVRVGVGLGLANPFATTIDSETEATNAPLEEYPFILMLCVPLGVRVEFQVIASDGLEANVSRST
jgi:hypothetical protein